MFGVLAFFGVIFVFVSKEEISGHQAMQLATVPFVRTKEEGFMGSTDTVSAFWLWVYIRNEANEGVSERTSMHQKVTLPFL